MYNGTSTSTVFCMQLAFEAILLRSKMKHQTETCARSIRWNGIRWLSAVAIQLQNGIHSQFIRWDGESKFICKWSNGPHLTVQNIKTQNRIFHLSNASYLWNLIRFMIIICAFSLVNRRQRVFPHILLFHLKWKWMCMCVSILFCISAVLNIQCASHCSALECAPF